jgi:uncharacterized protein (DUF1778 family)
MSVLAKLPNLSDGKLTEPFTVKLTDEQKATVRRASEVARRNKKDFIEKVRQEIVSLALQIIEENGV